MVAYLCHPHNFSQHSISRQVAITISSSHNNFLDSQQTPTSVLSGQHKLLHFVAITISTTRDNLSCILTKMCCICKCCHPKKRDNTCITGNILYRNSLLNPLAFIERHLCVFKMKYIEQPVNQCLINYLSIFDLQLLIYVCINL